MRKSPSPGLQERLDRLAAFRHEAHQFALGAYSLVLAKDLEYGDVSESCQLLEGISKLLESRAKVPSEIPIRGQ